MAAAASPEQVDKTAPAAVEPARTKRSSVPATPIASPLLGPPAPSTIISTIGTTPHTAQNAPTDDTAQPSVAAPEQPEIGKTGKRPAETQEPDEATQSSRKKQALLPPVLDTPKPPVLAAPHARPPPPAANTQMVSVPTRQGRDSVQRLYEQGAFQDVVLRVGTEPPLPAHRMTLAAHSPFFAKMFCIGMSEQETGDITIEDINHEALVAVVTSFYSSQGTIALSPANVGQIIRCASRLQTVLIEKTAVHFFCQHLEPSVAAEALCFATEMASTGSGPSKNLFRQSLAYASEHFHACAAQPSFLDLPLPTVHALLASDYLECEELAIFKALLSWIRHDEANRAGLMPELLPLIRFPQMLPSELKLVSAEPLLTHLPGGLLMPLLAECVPGAGDKTCARLRPRSGSVRKSYRFAHLSTGSSCNDGLSLLDRRAIVSTVANNDGGCVFMLTLVNL